MIKVRFPPSPTGEMHIANLRTAIFNWIFAKQNNGKFFIRIEDTDEERSKIEYTEKIFYILKKFNIDYDLFDKEITGNIDGIVTQSKRYEIYQKYAYDLYDRGLAFFCQCIVSEEEDRCCDCKNHSYTDGVLRYNITKNINLSFNDLVFGKLEINTTNIENFALLRSNKTPTYMLAVVVDDIEMEISHVIRGEDHRTNTFKQILLYEAFNKTPPIFGHLPMILGEDGKKLSKRNGNTSVDYYLKNGYVTDALFNIVLKLGWGFENEEIISREEIMKIFNFKNVKKSSAQFDEKKLLNFSGKYLRNYKYINELNEYLKQNYNVSSDLVSDFYEEGAKRSNTLKDFYDNLHFIFHEVKNDVILHKDIVDFLNSIKTSDRDMIFNMFKVFCENNNYDFKEITKLIRLKLTNKEYSIDIFKILAVYNKHNIPFVL